MQIIDYPKRFIIFISSYLGGITALCYVMGFLAETIRWHHFGVPGLEIASRQYLVTGAKFFGLLLPGLVDGLIVLGERYLWLLLLIIIVGGISIWSWRKMKVRQGVLLVGEAILLVLLFSFLFFTGDSFLGTGQEDARYLSISTTDLLFKQSYIPPPVDDLRDNYIVLVALFFIFTASALPFLHAYRKQKKNEEPYSGEASQGASSTPSPEKGRWKTLRRVLSTQSPAWRIVHGFLLFWIFFFILVDILILPMQYAHLLVYKEFPVVKVTLTPDLFPDLETIPELVLLRREKDNLLFYAKRPADESGAEPGENHKPFREIWFIKEHDVRELRVLKNQPIWPPRSETELKQL